MKERNRKSRYLLIASRSADDPLKIVVRDRGKAHAVQPPFKFGWRREMAEQVVYLSRDLLFRRRSSAVCVRPRAQKIVD